MFMHGTQYFVQILVFLGSCIKYLSVNYIVCLPCNKSVMLTSPSYPLKVMCKPNRNEKKKLAEYLMTKKKDSEICVLNQVSSSPSNYPFPYLSLSKDTENL